MPPRKKSPATSRGAESGARQRSSAAIQISFEQFFSGLRTASAARSSGKPLLSLLAEQNIIPPVVLIETGGFRSRRLIEWIKTSLFDGRPDSIVSAFGSELTNSTSVDSLASSLTSYSLLAPVQLVAVFDADKVKAAHAGKIAAALQRGKDVSLAILTASDGDKSPLMKDLGGIGIRVTVPEIQGPALAKWISGEVARSSAERKTGSAGSLAEKQVPATITAEAANHLAQLFGADLSNLSHEIEKLVLLADRGTAIDAALVRKISIRESEHNTFELFHRIAKRDVAGAANLVELLVNQGFHPLQISAFLSKAVRTAIAAKDYGSGMRDGGEKLNGDIANPWFSRNLGPATGALKPETLRTFLTALRKLDADLKGSKLAPELVTSLAAARMAARLS